MFYGKFHVKSIVSGCFRLRFLKLIDQPGTVSIATSEFFFFKVTPANLGLPWMQAGLDQCCSLCHDVLGELNGVEWS